MKHLLGTKTKRTNPAPPSEDNVQFVSDKPPEEMTSRERSLANLRAFTPEGRKLGTQKCIEAKMLDRQLRTNFKRQAKAYSKILGDIPNLGALDVIRMCVHLALQENDYENAAKWAEKLAEYEKPKLQRVEKVIKNDAEGMSDDELFQTALDEGLLEHSGNVVKLKKTK